MNKAVREQTVGFVKFAHELVDQMKSELASDDPQ